MGLLRAFELLIHGSGGLKLATKWADLYPSISLSVLAMPRRADLKRVTLMNVSRINRKGPTSAPATRQAGGASKSSETFAPQSSAAPATLQKPANLNTISSVDALLALQAAPDATARRARAVKRASSLLDGLEDLKIALLSGRIPQAQMSRLLALLSDSRDTVSDPQLIEILDEIDLRAKVELAKLGRFAA